MAATLGSAFYGLYFVVSYPTYARLDEVFDDGFAEDAGGAPRGGGEPPGGTAARRVTRAATAAREKEGAPAPAPREHTLRDACFDALGAGMLVLCLLDAVRVARGEDLVVALSRPCKLDPSRTCAPFTRC